jgi:glutamate dehydrogenase (NAD(P)+)
VTGKPVTLGGSRGRISAAAVGLLCCIRAAAKVRGIDLHRATAAVQGFGSVGSVTAELLFNHGVKIQAVSDSRGAIYSGGGIDVASLIDHKRRTGSVAKFPGTTAIEPQLVLEQEVDILVPAALENQITLANVGRVQAKIIAEAANGPTTPGADGVLHKNGVTVLPDILANAGGVTVSYFEWVQDLQELFWDEDSVNHRLEKVMGKAFEDVYRTAAIYDVNLRTGAYILAVDRVAMATKARGIWP